MECAPAQPVRAPCRAGNVSEGLVRMQQGGLFLATVVCRTPGLHSASRLRQWPRLSDAVVIILFTLRRLPAFFRRAAARSCRAAADGALIAAIPPRCSPGRQPSRLSSFLPGGRHFAVFFGQYGPAGRHRAELRMLMSPAPKGSVAERASYSIACSTAATSACTSPGAAYGTSPSGTTKLGDVPPYINKSHSVSKGTRTM